MTATQLLEIIAKLSGVAFVVTSMVAMGLSLTVPMILEPLRRWPIVVGALAVNFVVVPLAALGIAEGLSLDPQLRDGLLIIGLAAGAPFLPKLVQGANGDIAFAVGLMVVLMVATVIFLPLMLPWLLEGVSIGAWSIAKSLVVLMLVPLAIALAVRANWPDVAAEYQPLLAKTSSVAVIVLVVVALGLNVENALDLVGTRGFIAIVGLVVVSCAVGWAVGGRDPGTRSVVALGTGQRNLSAALVVATQNFPGTQTLTFVLVGSVVSLLVLLPSAPLIGRLSGTGTPITVTPAVPSP
ncbi:MAG: bile acid:sodium symporter family protein [Ilumatobacter sp.]|nr:MAG: bile acid:sodium symporter family protein [Ilumatobacter sp.]